jgi:3-hydroxyisobutyrate dehydrogenase
LGAQAGTLTFMVGSESEKVFQVAKTYLSLMGKNITFCGTTGNGQVAKICNNVFSGMLN